MEYTLHMELTDGTLDLAFTTCANKAAAMRVAKVISKSPSFECVRLIVNDKNDMTVASFALPQWTP